MCTPQLSLIPAPASPSHCSPRWQSSGNFAIYWQYLTDILRYFGNTLTDIFDSPSGIEVSLADEESAGPQLGGREALQKLARMDHYMEDADPVDEETHREQFSLERDRQGRFEELDEKVERLDGKVERLLSHFARLEAKLTENGTSEPEPQPQPEGW